MRYLSVWTNSGSRGLPKWRLLGWHLSAYLPRLWNRRCAEGCRVGTTYEWDGEDGTPRLGVRDHAGHCPRQPKYLGVLAKGWWHLWTLHDSFWRWSSEVTFALGGEDNMAQISLMLPIVGRVAAGFRVPRRLTAGWIYQRREVGIELRGLWPTILVAYDRDMADMRDYYVSSYLAQGKPLPQYVSRASLWPGWRLQIPTWRLIRLKNRVLGIYAITDTVLKVYDDVKVTLPEGDYPGKVTFYRSTTKRPRWPRARRDEVYGKFETELWMPWPGKGENSYDCGDDGTKEHTVKIGPGHIQASEIDQQDLAKVLGSTVASVLKYRGRYGRADWKPDGVGVLRV